ncbi:MAG: class I SAM-dependent methyltransferase [Planctomycetota bacterium]
MRDLEHWEEHPTYKDADARSARAFAEPKAERIARAAGLEGGEPILDVGAGTGHLTEAFRRRGHPVTALDLSRGMLARNRARARVRADALRLPFGDATFALVVESNLLHHVADPVAVLAEMARVSRGAVAAIEPNRNHPPMLLFSLLLREEWRALRFTRRHVARLAAAAGLRRLRLETTGWVYQNKTPDRLAGWLGRHNGDCPLAAYVLGVFEREGTR